MALTLTVMARRKHLNERWLLGVMVLGLVGLVIVSNRSPSVKLLGAQVPPFAVPLVANGDTDSQPIPAKQVLVLEFFASWCGSCRSELPRIQDQLTAPDVRLVAISLDDSAQLARSVVQSWGVTRPIALDASGIARSVFGVVAVPTLVVVSPTGVVTGWFAHRPSSQALQQAIDAARAPSVHLSRVQ